MSYILIFKTLIMRKLFLLLSVGLLCSAISKAQYYRSTGSELSIGVEGALPLSGWDVYYNDGSSKKISNFGIGATLKYAYNFNETLAATFQTGYIFFPGNNLEVAKDDIGQIPIKAGVRFSMSNFYIEPQFGLSSLMEKGQVVADNSVYSYSNTNTAFTYAIGIGTMAGRNFDIGVRYEAMSKDGTTSFLALRVAYNLPFGR